MKYIFPFCIFGACLILACFVQFDPQVQPFVYIIAFASLLWAIRIS